MKRTGIKYSFIIAFSIVLLHSNLHGLMSERQVLVEQLSTILNKQQALLHLQDDLDALFEHDETRTHPLTMAVIHLLGLGQNPKPPTQPKPSSSPRTPFTQEEQDKIRTEIKSLLNALVAQQLEELNTEFGELAEKLAHLQ